MTHPTRPLLLVALVTGCIPNLYNVERWEHASATDAEKRAADKYECMKENTSFKYKRNEDASERAGQEVDPVLFRACMEARGYTLVKKERARSEGGSAALTRPPEPGPLVLSADIGLGGFGVRQTDALDASGMVAGTASEPTQIRQTYAYGAGGPSFELGIGLPVGELGEIGVRAGLRAGPIDDRLVCGAAGEGNVYCDDPDRPDQFTAPIVTVGALGRAPFFPRIFGQAGVGVTTVGPVPATTEPFQIDRSEGEDDEAGQVTLAAQPAAVFPFALIGIGFDAIYAEPWGLRGACGIQYALRRTLYEGPSSLNYPGGSLGGGGGPPVSATCTLGVRWSPGGGG